MPRIIKFLFVAIVFQAVFTSCGKDDAPNLTPKQARDRFVGTWLCEETSQTSGTSTFDIHISADSIDETKVLIENFAFLGFQTITNGYIIGNDINIPGQNVAGFTVEGSGTMSGTTTIHISYSTDDGTGAEQLSGVFTKK